MIQNYSIPNRIKQPSHCCNYCGKTYKSKINIDKHVILCELVHNSKRNIDEDEDEIPSLKKMYMMMLELGKKYNTLDEKVNEINKFIIKKKKKINVLEWLNTNIHPEILFEKLHEKILINNENIIYLLNNSFIDTLNEIFSKNIYNISDCEYPIFAFVQKSNIFYIYDKIDENKIEWHELSKDKLIKFLNQIHMKLYRHFSEWKKTKNEEIRNSDCFATLCDKTLVKLMSVEFKQDSVLTKIRSSMYSKMKTDMKALIEYEFEF